MKRYSAIVILLLMAGALAASCSTPDIEIPSEMEEGANVRMHFSTKLAEKSTVTKSVDADGLTQWEKDEQIAMYYETTTGDFGTATANVDDVVSGDAKISAELIDAKDGGTVKFVYPASIVNATGDDFDASKLAAQHGTIDDISANFDVATGSSTLKVEGTTCSTDGAVTMTNQLLIGKFTPKCGGSAIDGITELTISDGTNFYTVTPAPASEAFGTTGIYVAMLPVNDEAVTITAETAANSYYYNRSGISLEAGKLYKSLSVNMMIRHDLATGSFNQDADAYIYQTNSGTATANTITISNGRKVILDGVNMLVSGNAINCVGDAEIVLNETNYVRSSNSADNTKALIKAGAYEPTKTTLIISGSGTLDMAMYNKDNSNGSHTGAFIGSDKNGDCGNITITGGTIKINPYLQSIGNSSAYSIGALIGAGSAYSGTSRCGDITITGGTVTLDTHKSGGACIGSGTSENSSGYSICGTITISDGTVTAQSWEGGAAIGSGRASFTTNTTYNGYSRCEGIVIEGTASVNATSTANSSNTSSSYAGAAIGAGHCAQVGSITISGGTVTAKMSDNFAPGIGSGKLRSTCGNITISGGTVEATGGKNAAGIGTGYGAYGLVSTCGTITITTGVTMVKATMGSGGKHSIGAGGYYNNTNQVSCGTVTIGGTTGQISTSPYTYPPTS